MRTRINAKLTSSAFIPASCFSFYFVFRSLSLAHSSREACCCRFSLLKLFTWFIGTIFEKFSSHFALCHSVPFHSVECLHFRFHFRIVGFYVHNWYKVIFYVLYFMILFLPWMLFSLAFSLVFECQQNIHDCFSIFVYRRGVVCVFRCFTFEY